jgi:hypothetical protein
MPDHEPLETAWKIHAALVDWTGKVDSKANFVLAIETAILAGVVQLTGEGRRLADLDGPWANLFFWTGVALVVTALVLASGTVRPHLRNDGSKLRREAGENFLYFGHLQYWTPGRLEEELPVADVLPMLSRQLVHMGDIAYRKHLRLQRSMDFLVAGAALVALAALLNG